MSHSAPYEKADSLPPRVGENVATPLFTPQNHESSKYFDSCAEAVADADAAPQTSAAQTNLVAPIVLMPLLTDYAASR